MESYLLVYFSWCVFYPIFTFFFFFSIPLALAPEASAENYKPIVSFQGKSGLPLSSNTQSIYKKCVQCLCNLLYNYYECCKALIIFISFFSQSWDITATLSFHNLYQTISIRHFPVTPRWLTFTILEYSVPSQMDLERTLFWMANDLSD